MLPKIRSQSEVESVPIRAIRQGNCQCCCVIDQKRKQILTELISVRLPDALFGSCCVANPVRTPTFAEHKQQQQKAKIDENAFEAVKLIWTYPADL